MIRFYLMDLMGFWDKIGIIKNTRPCCWEIPSGRLALAWAYVLERQREAER